MAITYTWKLTSLKKCDLPGAPSAIFQTYWKKIGTDSDGNTGEFSGATPFKIEEIDPNKFVPYDQLTEEIVLGWIKSIVVGTYEQHVNEKIDEAIRAKTLIEVQVDEANLPWAKPSDSVSDNNPPQ